MLNCTYLKPLNFKLIWFTKDACRNDLWVNFVNHAGYHCSVIFIYIQYYFTLFYLCYNSDSVQFC